jgi:subtilase family serine protease
VRLWIVPQGKAWHGPVPPLAAGKSAWTTILADMPVMVAQHVYTRVDDPDKVKESDEGNNGHVLK